MDRDRRNIRVKQCVELIPASVILKGREMAHKELGEELLAKFLEMLSVEGLTTFVEKKPDWDGKCYSCIVAPKGKQK